MKFPTKGREHKHGFNNNEREKPEKKMVVDDETGDKHQLHEVLRRKIIKAKQKINTHILRQKTTILYVSNFK